MVNPFALGWLFSSDGRITSGVFTSLIVCVEVIVASVGLCLAVKGNALWTSVRGMTKREATLLVISSLLALILGDMSLNVIAGPTYKLRSKYGWTVPENVTKRHTVQDQPGQFHTVENRYFRAGFKRWGNLNSPNTKVLILGDSYTQMTQVSNGEEWYGYLEKAFGTVEWFVHGTGGYGSLQEYMVLNDYIDQIKPDLVLWQFCANDYLNNFYLWDRKIYPYNNFGIRPYLEDGQIVYKLPMPLPFLRKYSKIADVLLAKYDAKMKETTRVVPKAIKATENLPTAFQRGPLAVEYRTAGNEAYRVTLEILSMARKRARDIPFFLFSTNQFGDHEKSLCVEASITCIPGVWEHLERQEAQGITFGVVDDGHWNKAGNRYVGEYLVQYLRHNPVAQELLTKPAQQ